jgi:UDP-N-acetylglucosamine--N-acetylmuramyl-(pentapeptide) pyrophosphoryl-undecaprenol N-acetylglucosamine transferase
MEQKRQLRCLIAAGGTAGHVSPALAVAEELGKRGVKVTFAGSPDRLEAQLVPDAGYELDTFPISGFPRRPSLALGRALLQAARAPRACGRILDARQPDVVLGGGGYVSGPMVYAAGRRKLPAALMEADAHLGLANRLAAPFAKRVFLSFPIEGREEPKFRVTGRPIPNSSKQTDRAEARRLFGLPESGPVLLVFGGSLGAKALNDLAVDRFGAGGPAVLHLSGTRDYESLRERVIRPDYRLFAYTEEFGAALTAADLALARAGGSVWELAAAGTPAVLVPGGFATGDHQTKNAEYFEHAGGAIVVPETELGRVADLVSSLLEDVVRLGEMSDAMLAVARPNAAAEIAEELIALAA